MLHRRFSRMDGPSQLQDDVHFGKYVKNHIFQAGFVKPYGRGAASRSS